MIHACARHGHATQLARLAQEPAARNVPFARLLVTIAMLLASALQADAAIAWRDGLITETYTLNCLSQQSEFGIGAFVGQLYDISYAEPYVGERFYMRIHVSGLGHPCADTYLDVQFAPPAGVTASAAAGYPLRCFYHPPGTTAFTEFGVEYGCPQPPFRIETNPAGTGYRLDQRKAGGAEPLWFLPGGASYEFWIPVISDRPLDGLRAGTSFDTAIHAIDAIYDYWTYPWQSVYVAFADPVFGDGFD